MRGRHYAPGLTINLSVQAMATETIAEIKVRLHAPFYGGGNGCQEG